MAHIKKRAARGKGGKTRWRARYIDPTGRERSKSFDRRVDAEQFCRSIEGDKLRGSWTDPRLGQTRLNEWAEQWWEATLDQRESTRQRTRAILDRHILPAFGSHPLASITHLDLRAWVAQLSSSGLAPLTVRKIVQTLSQVLVAAVDARLLVVSPADRLRLPEWRRRRCASSPLPRYSLCPSPSILGIRHSCSSPASEACGFVNWLA
jgi:hypothetical protein